jgi:hypothetical protein
MIWSASDNDYTDQVLTYEDILDQVAVEGIVEIHVPADEFFGGVLSKPYFSTLVNPTWLDLYLAADQSLAFTRDLHHVFFEGIREIDSSDSKSIRRFTLSLGS